MTSWQVSIFLYRSGNRNLKLDTVIDYSSWKPDSDKYYDIITHQSMLHELLSNLIGSLLLYYDFILLIHLLWRVQVAHIAWIYLLWWNRLIRQQFVINCSSSGRCSSAHFTSSDAAYDEFIKLQFEKFTQTVAETVLKFLVLSDLTELICLCLQASLIFAVFPRSASVGAC